MVRRNRSSRRSEVFWEKASCSTVFGGGTRVCFFDGVSFAVHEASHAIAQSEERSELIVSVPGLLTFAQRVRRDE